MEGIPQEEINYFKSLERRFWNKYNSMSEKERDNFDLWALESTGEWLKLGGFTRKGEENKRNFVDFMMMYSLVEMKPDDDTSDPSYVSRVIKLATDYAEYKKAKKTKTIHRF